MVKKKKETEVAPRLSDEDLKSLTSAVNERSKAGDLAEETLISVFQRIQEMEKINQTSQSNIGFQQRDLQNLLNKLEVPGSNQILFVVNFRLILKVWSTRKEILDQIS